MLWRTAESASRVGSAAIWRSCGRVPTHDAVCHIRLHCPPNSVMPPYRRIRRFSCVSDSFARAAASRCCESLLRVTTAAGPAWLDESCSPSPAGGRSEYRLGVWTARTLSTGEYYYCVPPLVTSGPPYTELRVTTSSELCPSFGLPLSELKTDAGQNLSSQCRSILELLC